MTAHRVLTWTVLGLLAAAAVCYAIAAAALAGFRIDPASPDSEVE